MRGSRSEEYESLIPVVRYFIGYIWLIVFFCEVVLIVHASMDLKKMGYTIGQQYKVKKDLLDVQRDLDNRISQMESYQRIAELIAQNRPELGPPKHPAIEIQVNGLLEQAGRPVPIIMMQDNRGFLERSVETWRETQAKVHNWIQSLLE